MTVKDSSQSVSGALTRGFALHRQGKLREAEAVYRRVLEADPENPDALHLLGVLRRQSGEPQAAIELISRAIAVNGRNPAYHSNLGTALEAAGRRDEALAAYRRAVGMKPDFVEALRKLGTLLHATGAHGQAAAALARAARLRPREAEIHLALGRALAASGRHDIAAEAFGRAAAIRPDLAEAHYQRAISLQALGRKDAALAELRRAVEIKPDHDPALFALSSALLERGDAEGLLAACEECLKRDPGNRRMVSSKIIALLELGRREEARALLDFDRFVRPIEIAPPKGYQTLAAFNAALAEEVRNHPTLVYEKSGHATRFGGHTGDILVAPGPAVAALEGLIRRAVADYAGSIPDGSDDPLSAAKPARWKLQSWAVVMNRQGHQLAHIHPAAWLSGVYYVAIPKMDTAPADPHAGWIEFGRPQTNQKTTAEPEVRLYEPREGLMILFPSYLYHLTIPIETAEQRISIAFDVVPEGRQGGGPNY